MPERGIDCTGFAACCRTSSFAIPFSLGGMRPDGVGILWKRFRAPSQWAFGSNPFTSTHLMIGMIRRD